MRRYASQRQRRKGEVREQCEGCGARHVAECDGGKTALFAKGVDGGFDGTRSCGEAGLRVVGDSDS